MPIRAQSADGKIHEFPDGTSPSVIDRVMLDYAKSVPAARPAPTPTPTPAAVKPGAEAPNALEKMGSLGSLAASAADVPLSAIAGLAGSSKTFTDLFGADNVASKALDDVSRLASEWKSAGSREDSKKAAQIQKEAEGKGIWEEVKAAAKAFTYSPIETTASVLGSSVPYAAAALGAAALAPASGGASLAALYGTVGAAASGAASGAGMIKGDIYDALYSAAREKGVPEERARAAAEKAQEYAGPNTDQIALGSLFGAAAGATGLPRQALSVVVRNAERKLLKTAAERTGRKSIVRGVAQGALEEAIPEAAQAGQERYAQNVALKRAGYDVDPFAGVAGQAAFEGLASLIPGGFGGGKAAATENLSGVPLPPSEKQIKAERELARQAKAAGIDLDEESIGATYNALVAKLVADGMSEDQASIKAGSLLPTLIGVPASDLGEVPIAGATKPAPTVSVADVTPSPAKVEPTRTPVQEVTPDRLAETLPAIDADFAENAEDLAAEYGVTELTPEVRNAAAELAVSAGIAPIDAINSVLESAQRAAPTTTVAPSVDEAAVAPVADAIKQAAAPTGATIPSLAETAARDVGVAETAAPVVEEGVPPSRPTQGLRLVHGSTNPDLTINDIVVEPRAGTKQGKGKTQFGGFYASSEERLSDAEGYAAMGSAPGAVFNVDLSPDAVVVPYTGDITRISKDTMEAQRAAGADVLMGKDVRGRTEYVVINKDAIQDFTRREPAPTPAPAPAPVVEEAAPAPAPTSTPAIKPITEQTLRDAGWTNSEIEDWRLGRGSKGYAENAGRGFIYYGGRFTPATSENVAEITAGIEARIARNAATRDRIIATDEGKRTVIIGDGRPQFLAEHLMDLETSDNKLKGQIAGLNRQLERARAAGVTPAPVAEEVAPAPEAVAEEEFAAEEQEDEEIDYDEHPLMQEHDAKYKDAIEEIGGVETMKELRDLIKRLKDEGLIDADDVNDINDSINDAGSDREERFDAGTSALEEALNNQRDNQREDVEERIREAVEIASAPEAVAEEAAAEPEVDPYEAVLEDIEAAFKKGEITQPNYNTLKFGVKTRKATAEDITNKLQEYKDTVAEERFNQRYRRPDTETTGQGVAKEVVQEYINGLISGWKANIKVNVVDSVDDLPPTLKEAVTRDNAQGAQGFVTAEGDIYILASNLDDVSDAAATLYHEGLGHLGLRALFNKRLDGVLQQIYDGNKKLRDEADTWLEENSGAYPEDSNPKLRALEEVLAIQSEEGRVDASIWAKITAIIKDMGRRLGIKASFSDSEVRAILAMAHDQIINGPRESATIKGLRYMLSAWHGGPHNFDQFSTDAIGTGEGAQVYGWGLYFSSKKEIAEWYRDVLSEVTYLFDGKTAQDWYLENQPVKRTRSIPNPALAEARAAAEAAGKPFGRKASIALGQPLYIEDYEPVLSSRFANIITRQEQNIYSGSWRDLIFEWRAETRQLMYERDDGEITEEEYLKSKSQYDAATTLLQKMVAAAQPQNTGKLYQVNLNTEEENMLDWDKPLSKQSERVRQALASLGVKVYTPEEQTALEKERLRLTERYRQLSDEMADIVDKTYPAMSIQLAALYAGEGSELYTLLQEQQDISDQLYFLKDRKGADIYHELEDRFGSPKAASLALLEAGVRGNTYIGDSSGIKNYVIFSASDIEIANKYRRKKKTGPGKELQRAERMLARSRNPGNLNQATSLIMKVKRSGRRLQNLMNIIPGVITTKRGRFMLQFLTPMDVLRLAKRRSPALGMRLDKVALAMSEMRKARTTMQATLQQRTYRWNKFNVRFKEGGRILSDLINLSTLYDIDTRRAPNAVAFIAQDDKIREIIADPKLGQRAKDNRIKARTELVEAVYKRRDALLRPENGRGEGLKIFDMAAKAYRETFDRQLAGVLARISNSTLSLTRKAAATKQVKAMFAEAEKIGLYFPLGREGDYWMRIGQGKDREYQQFVSQIDRDLALRERYDEMVEKGEKRSYDDIIRSGELRFGDNANTLQDDVVENDPTRMLQGMLNELDAGNITDLKAVKEQLTQMYLQTMPKAAQAAAMQRREGISGFTANTLRTFATTQNAAASRLARLEHGDTIRNNLAAAYALIQNDPEQDELKPYVDQFAEFAGRQLAPTEGNPTAEFIATAANRATFLYMMTSLKTAIIQPLQLSTTGMSALVREYGASAPALAFRNMTRFYKLLGTSKLDEDGNVITKWGQPSMNDGGYVNDEPDPEMRGFLKFLWNGGNDRGAFSTNFTGDVSGDRQGDFGVYDNVVLETTRKTLNFVHNFMTGAGFHTERISREVMFMSAGVLEYKKLRKAGVSQADAAKRAEQKAADLTLETLFDYNVDAKPMAARGPVGRVVFQFATFTMNMSSMLIRNFYNAVSLKSSLQERRDASILFFGTMATTFMWAGATGMPLYTMFMGLADVARELFRPLLEGDDEDPRMYDAESGNPLAYASMDLWFREWFLPNMLGGGESQRAVEMGPISAATDINLNASLSLNDMYFRDEQPADSVADAIQNLIMRTGMGAAGNMVKQVSQGIDFMLAGDGQRAAEKLMPYNFLRQPLIARRLQEEGYITPKGVELKPAEFFTAGKVVAQVAGFGSTEVGEAQKRNILFSRATDKVDATRTKVMRAYGDAYLRYIAKPTAENLAAYEKADEQYNEYNMEYGLINPITTEQMQQSITARAEDREAARQLGGIQTNKNYRVLAQDMLQQGQ